MTRKAIPSTFKDDGKAVLDRFRSQKRLSEEQIIEEYLALMRVIISDNEVIEAEDEYLAIVEKEGRKGNRVAEFSEKKSWMKSKKMNEYFIGKGVSVPLYIRMNLLFSISDWFRDRPNPLESGDFLNALRPRLAYKGSEPFDRA